MSGKNRLFYFDWDDGKYKLNQENFIFEKTDMQDARRSPLRENNMKGENVFVNEQDAKHHLHEALDRVDSGRFKGSLRKPSTSQSTEEISKGHKVMVSVLSTRLLRLNAAQTLWHKDMNSFIEYVLRLDDDAVLVDLLPILTKRVKDDGPDCSNLSMGACLDLLPVLRRLLESKFEDYSVVSLDMIREIMKRWWKELQTVAKKEKENFNASFRCSRSASGVYMLLVSMTDCVEVLSHRTGKVGEKAKVLLGFMALI